MNQRWLIGSLLALFTLGCYGRHAPHAPTPATQLIATHSYVEFQPAWRIRVVIPITKSGSYTVKTEEMPGENGTLQLKASDDFVGYEIDHYSVISRNDGGITVRFQSAEIHRNNRKPSNSPKPKLPLFQLPPDLRYIRLAFLTRVSAAEHDAVILAASSRENMEALTARVEADPSEACTASVQEICSWVPEGVSVQPERKRGRKWVPAV